MKSYVKGIITGLLIGAAVSAIPVVAENIDVLFNEVSINVNGADAVQWGEDIDLGDGGSTPASILYKGTTYLPMRKLGELSGQKVYWNGDSKTVSMTSEQKDVKIVAEKPDKNGNVWTYYTFKDENDNSYLGIEDKTRGYDRIYRIISNVRVTDEAIYFVKFGEPVYENRDSYSSADLVKISFSNDKDTQDGEIIQDLQMGTYYAKIEDNIVFYFREWAGTNIPQTNIVALDYESGKTDKLSIGTRWRANNISTEYDNEKIKFTFKITNTIYSEDWEVIFNKETFTFSEQHKVEDNNETN